MYGREKRVLLREYLEQGWTKSALAEKLGISRRTVYHWIGTGQLDRDMDAEAVRVQGAGGSGPQDRPLPRDHRHTAASLSAVKRGAPARGDSGRGVPGRLHSSQGIRPSGSPGG